MVALYQLTFFLALVLLAIVITVFVLAVSLLGRAVNISLEEQQKAEKERQKHNQEQLAEIQDKLDQAKKEDKQPDIESLTKSLNDLKKQAKTHKRKLAWIKRKPKFLKVCWGVFIPGALFIFSIIFNALAVYFQTSAIISLSLWILSLITILSGITLICLTLKVVQGVAVTSEEISFVKQKDMFKTALLEVDEEKKPELALTFPDEELPITIDAGLEKSIRFAIWLTNGDIGRRPEVWFFAPQEFAFPNRTTVVQRDSLTDVGGLLTTIDRLDDCRRGANQPSKIVIKAPSKAGNYSLWYQLMCEQFVGPHVKFKVIVK